MARSADFKSRVLAQKTVWAAGAYDALSAKLIEEAGFDALLTSGFGISASYLGQPDAELYTMSENLAVTHNVVNAVSIPVVADITSLMGIPVVMMGYGLDTDGLHSPNEHYSIEMFQRGIETAIVYLEELAQLPR